MKKLKVVVLTAVLMVLLAGCNVTTVDHSDRTIVQMTVEDKNVDEHYITSSDGHYNLELSYNGSKYILKDKTIFKNVKAQDSIDVLYVINYDADNKVMGAYIEPITQRD